MSLKNRRAQYEKNKNNKVNHLLSDALRREFEGETAEALEAREKKEKKIAEKKLKELDEVETPTAAEDMISKANAAAARQEEANKELKIQVDRMEAREKKEKKIAEKKLKELDEVETPGIKKKK